MKQKQTSMHKQTILRLSSDKSSSYVVNELKKEKYNISEFVLYKTVPKKLQNCPKFTSILFTSPSSIESFVSNFGEKLLENKNVCVIGNYTKSVADKLKSRFNIICPKTATLENMVFELALYKSREKIEEIIFIP